MAGRREAAGPPQPEAKAEAAPRGSGAEVAPAAEPESVPLVEGMAPLWPDEAAESAFRAEARERGEPVIAAAPSRDEPEGAEAGALPQLEPLVARIPADVREVLEDLFRARFVGVKRVPRKALKD